jgi:hypothetical protein
MICPGPFGPPNCRKDGIPALTDGAINSRSFGPREILATETKPVPIAALLSGHINVIPR